MLQFTTILHRKQPGYEVKAVITISKPGDAKKQIPDDIKNLRDKLEQIIPGSYKTKYNLLQEELIITTRASKASEGQIILHKINDFIKTAAMALKLK